MHDTSSTDEPMPGFPWIGYRLTKPGSDAPLLEDVWGRYWGQVVFLSGETSRSATVRLPPGEYHLEMVLRVERQAGVISAQEDLWSYSGLLSVGLGDEAVIEIPWE